MFNEPGFEVAGLRTVDVFTSGWVGPQRAEKLEAMLERLREVPGVDAASFTHAFPMSDRYWTLFFRSDGPSDALVEANVTVVDPGYVAVHRGLWRGLGDQKPALSTS